MGHMNVSFYVAKFDEATWQLFAAMGLTGRGCATRSSAGRGCPTRSYMAGVEQHIEYKRELFPGDVVTVTSTILEVKDKVLRFAHEMRNDVTGEVAAKMVVVAVHLDATARKARALPEDVRDRARSMMGDRG